MPRISLVLSLADSQHLPNSHCGSGGLLAAELVRQHIPLPPGICIPRPTFEYIAYETHLSEFVRDYFPTGSLTEQATSKFGQQLYDFIRHQPLPTDLARELWRHYATFSPHTFVQLHLSPTTLKNPLAEPLIIENISGENNLSESLLELWARHARQVLTPTSTPGLVIRALTEISVVAIAQPLATTSGKAYSCDPQTGAKTTVVIESSWGEQPTDQRFEAKDRLAVDIRTWQVVSHSFGVQHKQYHRLSDAWRQIPVPTALQSQSSITDAQAQAIAQLVNRLKRGHLHHISVQWVAQGQQLFVTSLETFSGTESFTGVRVHPPIVTGQSVVGGHIMAPTRLVLDKTSQNFFQPGEILVVHRLTHEHLKLISRAGAVVTDTAVSSPLLLEAIRRYQIPTVANTQHASRLLRSGQVHVVNASNGTISTPVVAQSHTRTDAHPTITKVFVAVGDAQRAAEHIGPGTDGVGLLRSEYTVVKYGVHPLHLLRSSRRADLKQALVNTINDYRSVQTGLPVIYRSLNLTTQELGQLQHSQTYETPEPNPHLGYRGALRILHQPDFFHFELEVLEAALKHAPANKALLGLMVPFVRSPAEARLITHYLKDSPLLEHPQFELWLQLTTPENVLQLEHYLMPELSGVSFHTKNITHLAHGTDPHNPDITNHYSHSTTLTRHFIEHCMRTVREANRHRLNRPLKCSIHLEDFDHELAALAVRLGAYAITVKPQVAPLAKECIMETEAQPFRV